MKKKVKDRLKNTKAADAPRKAEKVYRPPGSGARKAGMIVFWVLFIFILLAFLTNLLFGGGSDESEEPEEVVENPAAGLEGVEFAKSFAETYFTWTATAEGWETQAEQLAPMIGDGLDENAGIIQADQTWSSSAGDILLETIEETGENKALITLSVDQVLKSGEDEQRATHTFTVPVQYAGAFAIYDLPSFTAVPETNTVKFEKLKGDPVDGTTETNIKNFLPTFFQSYASDSPDKLAYFFQSEDEVKGLEGSVVFVEVADATVVQTASGYEIAANVIMAEPTTETKFTAVYRLSVIESGGRYVVTKLNQGAE